MIGADKVDEPVYFYLSNTWYKGGMPSFYDADTWELSNLLRTHYPKLKEEIMDYYQKNSESIKSNFTPYNYKEKGWKTVNLYTYGLRYEKVCESLPYLDSVVRKIPGMTMAQIAVLDPGVRIKAHLGDTNAIIRTHLGIHIPGQLPDLGLRVEQRDVCWKEGDVFSFCIVHRHYAWNYTDQQRIALIIDVIHPSYKDKIAAVCAESLALIGMKFIATRFPFLKGLPRQLTRALQLIFSVPFRILIWIQGTFRRKV